MQSNGFEMKTLYLKTPFFERLPTHKIAHEMASLKLKLERYTHNETYLKWNVSFTIATIDLKVWKLYIHSQK